jgi:hypothetical protein
MGKAEGGVAVLGPPGDVAAEPVGRIERAQSLHRRELNLGDDQTAQLAVEHVQFDRDPASDCQPPEFFSTSGRKGQLDLLSPGVTTALGG